MYTISAIFLSESTLEIIMYLVWKYYCCWLYFPKSATKFFPSYMLFLQWHSFHRQVRFMFSPFKVPGLETAECCYVTSEVRSERVTHECMLSHFSRVQLFVILWTVARQALLSKEFSRQEHWSGLPCPPPGDLPDPGIKPASLTSPALSGRFFTTSATCKGDRASSLFSWDFPSWNPVTMHDKA